MERRAAGVTLLVLFVSALLSGASVPASGADGCNDSTLTMRGAAASPLASAAANPLAGAATVSCTHTAHLHTSLVGELTCDAPLMASRLTKLCRLELDAPGAQCCDAVLMTVDQDTGCLCTVAEDPEFDLSDLSVPRVWQWYKSCGGRRRSVPRDEKQCEPGSAPPPSPPPPPPSPAKPEAPLASPVGLWIAVGLLCAGGVVTISCAALKLWLTVQEASAKGLQQPQDRAQDRGVSDPAARGVPDDVCSGQIRPRADETANATAAGQVASSSSSGREEDDVSSPVSSLGVEGEKLARVRLPSPPPFQPSVYSPVTGKPVPREMLAV